MDSDFDLMIVYYMFRAMTGYFVTMGNMSPHYETTMKITQMIINVMVTNIDL
jgi:hypothetical protein